MRAGPANALLAALMVTLATSTAANAQPRTSEIGVRVGAGGTARRALAAVQTAAPVAPSWGIDVRFAPRLVARTWGELHLGGQIGATAWRTTALRRTEHAWRTFGDLGVVLRWTGPWLSWAPVVTATGGFTVSAPSIPELFNGVRFGLGYYAGLSAGVRWRRARTLLGWELGWTHHRTTAPWPRAVTRMHQAELRFSVGFGSHRVTSPTE